MCSNFAVYPTYHTVRHLVPLPLIDETCLANVDGTNVYTVQTNAAGKPRPLPIQVISLVLSQASHAPLTPQDARDWWSRYGLICCVNVVRLMSSERLYPSQQKEEAAYLGTGHTAR